MDIELRLGFAKEKGKVSRFDSRGELSVEVSLSVCEWVIHTVHIKKALMLQLHLMLTTIAIQEHTHIHTHTHQSVVYILCPL